MNFEYSGSTNSYMVDSENVSLGNYYELSVEYDMNLLDGRCVVNWSPRILFSSTYLSV